MTCPHELLRILIVDDEPIIIHLLIETLRDYGFDLQTALNGHEALQRAREMRPDLVLLDIRMPEMDGFAVCDQLKSDPATADIPVIFLTALADTEWQLKAFRGGVIDYITKPFDAQVVLARVLVHLQQDRLRRNLERRVAALEGRRRSLIDASAVAPDKSAESITEGVERVAGHLLDHLAETPSLDDLARLACTNRRTLNAEFQAIYQLPVFEWLREQRLSRAARLLRTTDLPIAQIAGQVGFNSHVGLGKAFRERLGVSPGEYRRTHRT